MPRPVNADAAATKQRILDMALELFSVRGADAVPLRELADAAKVSPAMIYHCFGGKSGLHQAAIDTMYSELTGLALELIRMLSRTDLQAAEVFNRAVRVAFEMARRNHSSIRLLEREVASNGALDARRAASLQDPFIQSVTERLATLTGVPAKELRWPLHASVGLVARYAITKDDELVKVTGASSVVEALAIVEDNLCRTVRHLMKLPSETYANN